MTRYAATTEVSTDRSKAEREGLAAADSSGEGGGEMSKDWKTNPDIQAAGELLHHLKATHLIAFYRAEDARVGYVSYGKGGRECREAREIAESAFGNIEVIIEEVIAP
jgi:hypothetical protein